MTGNTRAPAKTVKELPVFILIIDVLIVVCHTAPISDNFHATP
jgi:hypothetical protein